MKNWKDVSTEVKIHKGISSDCVSVMDTTIYKYIQKMCKQGCKFYEGECKKKRNIFECSRKGLKNKE